MDKIEEVCKRCVVQQSSGPEICSELSALLPPGFKLIYTDQEECKEGEVRREIVQEGDEPVPITGDPGVDVEKCLSAKIYHDWRSRLSKKFLVRGVRFQSLDMFGPRVGFIKMNADLVTRQGNRFVPGVCLLRGGAVAILILINCDGEEYVVLTAQPRAPVSSGGLLELPAGMLDGSGNFAGVAAKEIKEETGLDINLDDLINLSDLAWGAEGGQASLGSGPNASPVNHKKKPRGMYPSAGGCDEFITVFLHRTAMSRDQLEELEGKLTGCVEEGEMITLSVIKYKDIWRVADSKGLAAMALYEGLKTVPEFSDMLPEPMDYVPEDHK